MKILQIHKYFSHQRGGGSVSAFFETKNLLEKKGHQVIIFSMQDETNEKSIYEKYFIKHFDINDARTLWEKICLVFKIINNREAARKIEELIKAEKPDVAHVHNIYHYITPSVFRVLRNYNIPIVFKLSDYKVICPNYKLFNQGKICERCKGAKYYNAFLGKCLKNSYSASAVAMLEAYYHKIIKSYEYIDYFLAPSNFMKDICVAFGIPKDKILTLRNVLNFNKIKPGSQKENYFSYVGRVSEEKGLGTLLLAVKILQAKNKLGGFRLKIVGAGPEEEPLKKLVGELEIEKAVDFMGFLKNGSPEWRSVMQKSLFTVLPSSWYDNSPIAISEALAFGTPAIVSDKGGTKEMIDEKCGLVFAAGNENDLAEKILFMLQNDTLSMQKRAIERVQEINSEEGYYSNLMEIYKQAIAKYK